jgi:hypothetical protein
LISWRIDHTVSRRKGGRFIMRRIVAYLITLLSILVLWIPTPTYGKSPAPFGFEIGKTTYEDAVKIAQTLKLPYQEYEKRQFKILSDQDPSRGKNTFIKISPKEMKGLRSILVFLGKDSTVDAVIVPLEPNMFDSIIQELDEKYNLVTKSLHGEDPSAEYPLVRWQKENVYIEVQQPGPYLLRLVYVDKLLYENYKDFLHKTYESYRYKLDKREWMKEL